MRAQDIIDYVESHTKEEGNAYLNSLFDDKNFMTFYDVSGSKEETPYVVKDKVCLKDSEVLHFPYGLGEQKISLIKLMSEENTTIQRLLKGPGKLIIEDSAEQKESIKALDALLEDGTLKDKIAEYGSDISGIEILLKICEYNNMHPESDIVDRLLDAAHKNGVKWCDVAKDREEPLFYINTLCSHYSRDGYGKECTPLTGTDLKRDLGIIKQLYEFERHRTCDDYHDYLAYQDIREDIREKLFEEIAKGTTSYSYETLKEFFDLPADEQEWVMTNTGTGSDNGSSWIDETDIFKTESYKRAKRRMEYDTLKHENKKMFVTEDFSELSDEQKTIVLEFTDSKDIAKAVVASYQGNTEYNDMIAKHLTKDEFEQIMEDYKITFYRRENERLSAENAQLNAENEQLKKENEDVAQKAAEIEKAKVKINQERATRVSANEDLSGLTDEQRKDNFAAKKKLMEEHPIMLEPCLNSMCESYVATKDEAIKNEMLSDLYAVRKGGDTNAEKREMAKTFKRVLDKNPALQKDENLVALSKIDYAFSQPTKMVKKQIDSRG